MDFSKIKTTDLKKAIDQYYMSTYCKACTVIRCENCPFSGEGYPCEKDARDEYFKLFEKELERRVKLERPKLEPGMVVRLKNIRSDRDYGLYVFLKYQWCISINGKEWQDIHDDIIVTEIYEKDGSQGYSLFSLKDHLVLIWKKSSEKEDKIKKIKETITEMTEEHNSKINKLKEQIKDLEEED